MKSANTPPGAKAPAHLMKQMTGLAFMQGMLDGTLPHAPIAAVLKMEVTHVEHGRVVFEGTPEASYYNPIGSVHGGYAATLLDSCMGCAVHTLLPAGRGYSTLEFKVNFVRPMTGQTGRVRAEGRVIHPGNRAATAEGHIYDSAGKLLAHGTTTCLVFPL
ncbi:MAG: PaaI family thioesterase [Proteobacteria bacterium]|nr:PaaI family thioesterase [Pseudomonadota bacterium]